MRISHQNPWFTYSIVRQILHGTNLIIAHGQRPLRGRKISWLVLWHVILDWALLRQLVTSLLARHHTRLLAIVLSLHFAVRRVTGHSIQSSTRTIKLRSRCYGLAQLSLIPSQSVATYVLSISKCPNMFEITSWYVSVLAQLPILILKLHNSAA